MICLDFSREAVPLCVMCCAAGGINVASCSLANLYFTCFPCVCSTVDKSSLEPEPSFCNRAGLKKIVQAYLFFVFFLEEYEQREMSLYIQIRKYEYHPPHNHTHTHTCTQISPYVTHAPVTVFFFYY